MHHLDARSHLERRANHILSAHTVRHDHVGEEQVDLAGLARTLLGTAPSVENCRVRDSRTAKVRVRL